MLSEGSESIDERKVRVYIYQLYANMAALANTTTVFNYGDG